MYPKLVVCSQPSWYFWGTGITGLWYHSWRSDISHHPGRPMSPFDPHPLLYSDFPHSVSHGCRLTHALNAAKELSKSSVDLELRNRALKCVFLFQLAGTCTLRSIDGERCLERCILQPAHVLGSLQATWMLALLSMSLCFPLSETTLLHILLNHLHVLKDLQVILISIRVCAPQGWVGLIISVAGKCGKRDVRSSQSSMRCPRRRSHI